MTNYDFYFKLSETTALHFGRGYKRLCIIDEAGSVKVARRFKKKIFVFDKLLKSIFNRYTLLTFDS